MKRIRHIVGILAVALFAAGCSSTVPLEDKSGVPVETRTPSPVDGGAAGKSAVTTVDTGKDAAATASRIVYFDFDSFVVKDEFRPLIEAQAKRMAANRALRVTIEGHTDERGGREYNLSLGQKRAEAVLRSLTLLGANETQLEAVSFGKERPAVTGSDEAAWARNRRAEIKER
jgi:peptidoglycan-associated lipoprotein